MNSITTMAIITKRSFCYVSNLNRAKLISGHCNAGNDMVRPTEMVDYLIVVDYVAVDPAN